MRIDKTLNNYSELYNFDKSHEGIPIFIVLAKLTTISDHFLLSTFVYGMDNPRKNLVLGWKLAFFAKKRHFFMVLLGINVNHD